MCPGIHDVEGTCHGHDAIAKKHALEYLTKKGLDDAVAYVVSSFVRGEDSHSFENTARTHTHTHIKMTVH